MPCSEEAFKLDRMRELLRRLGNPQDGMPIVHVAGTKGKGSTSAMMAAVLSAAGYRTGLFTSPHLDRVEERMAIDGRPCSAEELAELVELVRPAVEALDRAAADKRAARAGPTYFEIVTAMALCHFARRRWTRPCWKWGWAAGSIRPTSARRASRSSPASASTTPSSWARRWRRSPPRKRASSSPACRSSAA